MRMFSIARAAILLAVATTAGTVIAQEDDAMARDLAVVQKPITTLRPVSRWPLVVTAWVDHADRTYAIGEKVQISVRPNMDAYITVINVGTSGKTTILFPNSESRANLIRAGQTMTLPARSASWAVQAQGPGGIEVIKVIASTSPKPIYLEERTSEAGPFRAFEETGDGAARDLALMLNSPKVPQWAETTRLIRVVPFR